eukprot:COSAG01_NODE_26389_length_715_cov_2.180195_1_plen_69_part_01
MGRAGGSPSAIDVIWLAYDGATVLFPSLLPYTPLGLALARRNGHSLGDTSEEDEFERRGLLDVISRHHH